MSRATTVRMAMLVGVGAAALGGACLPSDDRATPGKVTMTIEPSPATTDGFDTADGWRVTFERFLSAAGDVGLDTPNALEGDFRSEEPEHCVDYTDARYDRLFDFAKGERAHLGLAYGTGLCSVQWRLKSPSTDSLLQPGASNEDLTFMRVRETDPWADDARVNLWVIGRAERAGVTKRFDWKFRQGDRVSECRSASGEGNVDELTVVADAVHELHGVVRGEELFRAAIDDASPLAFDVFANADADGDGDITFEELALAPVTVELPADLPDLGDFGVELEPPETLGDLVYQWQIRRVGSFVGASDCVLR